MSQADELLEGLSENEIAMYSAGEEVEPHIVIGKDRFITVPDKLKKIAVQHDHNIETVTFDCPRYWDGHDLSTMTIYINYMRPDGEPGSYIADNVAVDETDENVFHFTWTISNHVTYAKGNLKILVCAKKVNVETAEEENHWNSELNTDMYVATGMECETSVMDSNPDIIGQLLMRMDAAENAVYVGNVENAVKYYSETKTLVEENVAKQDVINSRIDQVMATVSSDANNTTYTLVGISNPNCITGYIKSNSTHAVLVVTGIDINDSSLSGWIVPCCKIPDGLIPWEIEQGLVGFQDSATVMIGAEDCRIMIWKYDDGYYVVAHGIGHMMWEAETVATALMIPYTLNTTAIPELADLRVGPSGTTYDSAGEMVRSEMQALEARLAALEK